MESETNVSNSHKLRKKPKKNTASSAARKRELTPETIPKEMRNAKGNADNSTEGDPKKKKRKVESGSKVKANPKSKKKSNPKSKLYNNDSSANGKGKPSNKTPKYEATSKKSSFKKIKEVNLPLVSHTEAENSEDPDNSFNENPFADYHEYTSDEDCEYFNSYDSYDSYSDDYDAYNEEYFHGFGSDYSDYSDYENSLQCNSDSYAESDPDYELPKNVPEDLIIHRGTAQKHELNLENDINFDSDNDDPQVVEMSVETQIKEVRQPEAYSKDELHKLNVYMEKTEGTNKLTISSDSEKECPSLVPIIDGNGFQLYNSESDSTSSCEFSDSSSSFEEDINLKYIQSNQECNTDCEEGNSRTAKKKKTIFNVDIINVENCTSHKKREKRLEIFDIPEETSKDHVVSELLKSRNMVSKVGESVIKTVSICDKAILKECEEINENSNKMLDSLSTSKTEALNTDAVQHSQTLSKEIPVDNERDSQISSPELDKSIIHNDIQENPFQKKTTTKFVNEKLNFRTMFINAVNSNVVLVLIKDPFYLYGTVCMTLLAGQVEVYGYKPRLDEELEIFSPRGCSTIQIKCIPTATQLKAGKLANKLKPLLSSFSSCDLQLIENAFDIGQDAILLLNRNIRRRKVKNIFKNYMNENVFPNMNSIRSDRPFYTSEYQLDCVINAEAERCLRVPEEWQNLLFSTKPKVLLAGGKSVGKSTLLRYLLNRQLAHSAQVLVIDLDIGQAEIFVPQTVSCTVLNKPLLGPGFFLNQQPTRAYVVGHSNIVLCSQTYIRAVTKLIDFCYSKEEFSNIPWLINTMGYNKGFGMELMSIIVQLMKPTDIVQLQSNKEINNFDMLLEPHVLSSIPRTIYTHYDFKGENNKSIPVEYKLHVLHSAIMQESRYQRDWEMSPKDLRYAMFLSRLSDVLQGNSEWLTDGIPLSALIKDLHFVNVLSNESTREEVVNAFEANLAYLCRRDKETSDPLECFGIGIVRAIDLQKVYLLPALPYDYLNEVNCLAIGEMPLPSSLFTNQGPKVRHMAAFLYNTIDAKTSKSIKQIYHRPSHFLKGKHKDVLNKSN